MSRKMTWTRPSLLSREWTLREGDRLVMSARTDALWRLSEFSAGARRWRVERKGFWRRRIRLLGEDSAPVLDIAVRLGGRAEATTPAGGRILLTAEGVLRRRFRARDGQGRALAIARPMTWPPSGVEVELQDASLPDEQALPILAVSLLHVLQTKASAVAVT